MTWQISFSVPHWAVSLFDDLIHSKGYCMTAFKNNEKPDSGAVIWLFEIFFEDELNKVSILSEVSVFAAFHRVQLGKVSVLKVPETDWLTENLSSFKPFAIERFWIYGSHQPKTMPSGSLRLCVNASRAFGTGEHETTQGCLIALHDLQKSRSFSRLITASRFASVLDVGCGTAILAMASVRLWSCRALAVDIDPDAIVVARDLKMD
jgi:ribosomal protein L11 methyltransferase